MMQRDKKKKHHLIMQHDGLEDSCSHVRIIWLELARAVRRILQSRPFHDLYRFGVGVETSKSSVHVAIANSKGRHCLGNS